MGNGTFLLNTLYFPTVGYRRSRELRDPAERRRRGLEAGSRPTTLEAALASGLERSGLRTVTFKAVISTPVDQIAVAPGALVDSWEEGGRRFVRYAVAMPMMPFFAIVSARYAVARSRSGYVDVEVYHHPGHDANVVDERPAYAAVDPFVRRVDRNVADNVRKVEGISGTLPSIR